MKLRTVLQRAASFVTSSNYQFCKLRYKFASEVRTHRIYSFCQLRLQGLEEDLQLVGKRRCWGLSS